MSIKCVDIEDPELLKKIALYGAKEFVLANLDPSVQNQLPFPSDYNFAPCVLPKKYERLAEYFYNIEARSDDVWIASFPKSGTTWVMNIAWLLQNNLDFSKGYLNPGQKYIEGPITIDEKIVPIDDMVKYIVHKMDKQSVELATMPSPRLLTSHLPAHLLPRSIWTEKSKLIYIYRNVKDVAISMYHMFQKNKYLNFQGSLEDFLDVFLNDHALYSPYLPHVDGFRKLKHLDHVLFLSYEEMLADSFAGVKKISEFLGYSYSDEQLKELTEHVSFNSMKKKNEELPSYIKNFDFFRKGKSGGYRDEMSCEYNGKFDEWENEKKHLQSDSQRNL